MYRHVVVAGTFDRLHKGHAVLLTQSFTVGEQVTIGLTTDLFIKKFKIFNSQFLINSLKTKNLKLKIQNYRERKKQLEQWLKKKGYSARATIVPLDDPFGPVVPQSAHDPASPDIEAIIVSTDTRARAEEINVLRKEAGWKPLAIVEVAMVPAQDLQPISSSRIRQNEINRDGRLILPDALRPELQQPLGKVLIGEEIGRAIELRRGSTAVVITVGDVATKTLLDAGIIPALSIIDGKVGRKPFLDTRQLLQRLTGIIVVNVKSGPGYISREALEAVRGSLDKLGMTKKIVILIDGEEDLLALPAIAYAREGSIVYYGQPGTSSMPGLVEVVVTPETKKRVVALISRFLS